MSFTQHADPLIGRLVDNRYQVRARVARGGMATVYVATDLRLERRVALKVMHHHLSDDDRFQSRFIQEARTAARLSDPHVVNVFDQGRDGEIAYLVMEYLPGITLRDLLKEQRRLTITQTITVMDAVLQGLAAAHREGLIHRDVKPENVLLAEDGRIKIGDFGLARATHANTGSSQNLLGTIAYLAPEMFTRGAADTRSDIYSLGIMLYEMLVGEQPYRGDAPMQIAFQHANDSVPRPSARNPGVPEQLDELVLWSTEKEPDDRPANAYEMLDRLREIEHQLGISPLLVRRQRIATEKNTSSDDEHEVEGHTALIEPDDYDDGPTAVYDPADFADDDTRTIDAHGDDNTSRLRRSTRRRRARGGWLLALVVLLTLAAAGAGWFWGSGPGSQVTVPQLAGMTFDGAEAALAEEELSASSAAESHLHIAAGEVIRSEPEPGTRVDRETSVTVVLSSGPAPVTVGQLGGLTADEVTTALDAVVIRVDGASEELFGEAAEGTVTSVTITPASGAEPIDCTSGCEAHEGDVASLQTSLGPLPNPVGLSLDDARAELDAAGVSVEVSNEVYSSEIAQGAVVSFQERDGGGAWRPGDTVHVTTSLGPELFDVPDVTGMTLQEARTTLEGAGFGIDYNPLWNAVVDSLTNVSGYSPNSPQPAGTTITLTISGSF